MLSGFGKVNELFDDREILVGERVVPFAETRSLRNGTPRTVLAGQQPAREGKIRNERQPASLTLGEDIGFGLAMHETILILHAGETRMAGLHDVLGLADLRRGEVRATDLANLSRDRKSTRLNSSHMSISYA